jgi:hypothetical protein
MLGERERERIAEEEEVLVSKKPHLRSAFARQLNFVSPDNAGNVPPLSH